MTRRVEQYTCVVERDVDGRVTAIDVDATDLEGALRHTRINGVRAGRVANALHDVLREAGVTGRAWSSRRPLSLDPVAGAQTELLVQAVKPLRRPDRIEQVSDGVAGMSREEASYWHAKARHPGGLRALRILLTDGAAR